MNEINNPESQLEIQKPEHSPQQLRDMDSKIKSFDDNLLASSPRSFAENDSLVRSPESKRNDGEDNSGLTGDKVEQYDKKLSDFFSSKKTADAGEMLERKTEVRETILPEAEHNKNQFLKDQDLEQYISPKKLKESIPENTTPLSPSEMQKQHGDGWNDSIVGFNDGKHSYVDVSKEDKEIKATAIHENFHQLSANDTKNFFGDITATRRGLSIDGKDTGINEALTEKYTIDTMKQTEPGYSGDGSAYNDAAKEINKFYSFGDNKAMFDEAYFTNNPEILRNHFEEVCWPGFYDDLSREFDTVIDVYCDDYARDSSISRINDMFEEYVECFENRGDLNEDT